MKIAKSIIIFLFCFLMYVIIPLQVYALTGSVWMAILANLGTGFAVYTAFMVNRKDKQLNERRG